MIQTSSFADIATRIRAFILASSEQPPIEDDFNRLALELFALQFAHITPYRRLCEARRVTPESVKHWTEVPALPTSAFKDLDITSLDPAERTTVFYSSGTTRQARSRHFHNSESLALYQESLLRWFKPHVLPDSAHGIHALFLSPPPDKAPNSSLVHMFETVRPLFASASYTGRVDAEGGWIIDTLGTRDCLKELIAAQRPVAVFGTAFSFVHLIDFLEEAWPGCQLPPKSRVFETGGYKGRSRTVEKKQLHRLITRWLGVPHPFILSEYGMSELSSQAYDTVIGQPPGMSGRIFHFPPWARSQIISPETGDPAADGETGLLRVVDLANVRSAMVIQTEDLAVRHGTGFELVGRAENAEPRGCSLMPVSD